MKKPSQYLILTAWVILMASCSSDPLDRTMGEIGDLIQFREDLEDYYHSSGPDSTLRQHYTSAIYGVISDANERYSKLVYKSGKEAADALYSASYGTKFDDTRMLSLRAEISERAGSVWQRTSLIDMGEIIPGRGQEEGSLLPSYQSYKALNQGVFEEAKLKEEYQWKRLSSRAKAALNSLDYDTYVTEFSMLESAKNVVEWFTPAYADIETIIRTAPRSEDLILPSHSSTQQSVYDYAKHLIKKGQEVALEPGVNLRITEDFRESWELLFMETEDTPTTFQLTGEPAVYFCSGSTEDFAEMDLRKNERPIDTLLQIAKMDGYTGDAEHLSGLVSNNPEAAEFMLGLARRGGYTGDMEHFVATFGVQEEDEEVLIPFWEHYDFLNSFIESTEDQSDVSVITAPVVSNSGYGMVVYECTQAGTPVRVQVITKADYSSEYPTSLGRADAIQLISEVAKKHGYKKSSEDLANTVLTDPEGAKLVYEVAQKHGYSKSIEDFKAIFSGEQLKAGHLSISSLMMVTSPDQKAEDVFTFFGDDWNGGQWQELFVDGEIVE